MVFLFQTIKNKFQGVQGDVASWEKEDGWETVGKVNLVKLRFNQNLVSS